MGQLRVYVGVAPGAGATCALLAEGERRARRGAQVLVGPISTHERPVTIERLTALGGLAAPYRLGDSAPRPPAVVLLDDLATSDSISGALDLGATKVPRWRDAIRLIDAGVDVVATVRVDQIESLSDLAADIRGCARSETVPDHVLRRAEQLEVVDVAPEALLRRFAHGNVVRSGDLDAVGATTFEPARLHRLRELAFEWMADRVEEAADRFRNDPTVHDVIDEDTPSIAVAIDGHPDGDRAIRRAARLADRLGAKLIGIHVSSSRGHSRRRYGRDRRDDGTTLAAQRQLVLDLGGELRSCADGVVTDGLISAAQAARCNQLVVRADGWALRRLVRATRSAGMDLHLVPTPTPAPTHDRTTPSSAAVVPAAIGVVAVVAFCFVLIPLARHDNVAIGALLGLSAITATATVVGVGSYRRARRARADAALLAESARAIVTSTTPLPALLEQVRRALAVDGVAVISPSADGPVIEVASGAPIPAGAPSAAADIDRFGRVLATSGRRLDSDELRLLRGFAAQVGAALEHGTLHDQARAAAVLAEADELRTAILRAVSHDLHTPIAGIKASVTSLRQADVTFTAAQRQELLATIETESDRLNRMVANLLDVGRLEAGALTVDLRPTYLEDVVAATLANVAHEPERVEIAVPETVPAALADPALLERALANLVANALAWSPPSEPVRIDAGALDDEVRLRVVDRGPGIPVAEREHVLVPFQRLGHKSLQAGAGLGLTVVSGFVAAIGGRLLLADTPGGGLTATIILRAANDASSAADPAATTPNSPAATTPNSNEGTTWPAS